MPPKKSTEADISVLNYQAEQNMKEHQEIKDMIKNLSDVVINWIKAQDEKIQKQEEKFVMKKELRAVSWVIGFLAVVVWLIINLWKTLAQ